jgi:hypothetical protein
MIPQRTPHRGRAKSGLTIVSAVVLGVAAADYVSPVETTTAAKMTCCSPPFQRCSLGEDCVADYECGLLAYAGRCAS